MTHASCSCGWRGAVVAATTLNDLQRQIVDDFIAHKKVCKTRTAALALLAEMPSMPAALVKAVQSVVTFCEGTEKPIGELLRIRRESAGLTRVELAARSGVSDGTIKFIETGRVRKPTGRILGKLRMVRELGGL